jgi:hypothetical protein
MRANSEPKSGPSRPNDQAATTNTNALTIGPPQGEPPRV